MTKSANDDLIHATAIADVPAEQVAPGITRRRLAATDFARGWAIDFAAGSQWPEVDVHEHEERYFVLSGEVVDNDQVYPAGTYVVLAAGSRHRPRTDTGAQMLGITISGR